MSKTIFILTVVLGLLVCSCKETQKPQASKGGKKTDIKITSPAKETQEPQEENGGKKMDIKITSLAFGQGGIIPSKYTCDGQNISPPLKWEPVPDGTKSIALISDDPDAPMGTWVHWVLFNLPPNTKELMENVPTDATLSDGAIQGITDFGRNGYGGPCPPSGTHRYFFKVYALDKMIDLPTTARKKDLLKAMEGHIISQGELMGRYKRK